MTFLFYKNNGTFGITNTRLNDILSETVPADIIDTGTEVGVIINRYFENIADSIDYILWFDLLTEKVSLKTYITVDGLISHETIEEDVEEFRISPEEIHEFINYIL